MCQQTHRPFLLVDQQNLEGNNLSRGVFDKKQYKRLVILNWYTETQAALTSGRYRGPTVGATHVHTFHTTKKYASHSASRLPDVLAARLQKMAMNDVINSTHQWGRSVASLKRVALLGTVVYSSCTIFLFFNVSRKFTVQIGVSKLGRN